jgi:hypothetical protein
MAGLDPPALQKPLRRGEGPAFHVFGVVRKKNVDARKRGRDEEKPSPPLRADLLPAARKMLRKRQGINLAACSARSTLSRR